MIPGQHKPPRPAARPAADENTLSVNINRLRKKLDTAGLHDFILTKKGIGYLVE